MSDSGQCGTAVRSGATSNGLTGMEIRDKIVGIVGCGRIGIQTAKLFHAFGARVLAYARHEKEEWEKEGIHGKEGRNRVQECIQICARHAGQRMRLLR